MASPVNALPEKIREQLIADHGRNTQFWPQELQDLVDPTISAKMLNPPLSGQIEQRLNREYEYYWAKDVCGQNPDHTRVEELRYVGFDYATTQDVKMCSSDTVRNPNKQGYSNEIRSGDRRLMKVPMQRWREMRKSQNVQALQMAYPQGFAPDGQPMSAQNLIPGVKTYMGSEVDLADLANKRRVSDASQDLERTSSGESALGNTAVHKGNRIKES